MLNSATNRPQPIPLTSFPYRMPSLAPFHVNYASDEGVTEHLRRKETSSELQ
jgi:hypothetical protein